MTNVANLWSIVDELTNMHDVWLSTGCIPVSCIASERLQIQPLLL
jgi:hypothetical protein